MIQLIDDAVTISEIFTVKNDRGLHTRPATEIVKCAAAFDADIMFSYQKLEVNAKSILGILMLTAGRGARIRITASGSDAEEAVQALLDLADKKFNIQY